MDLRLLPAQDVWVHGARRLPGVFGTIPPHFQNDRDSRKPYDPDELFVDVGLRGAAARRAIRVGDMVSFRAPLVELAGGRVSGRALDNRASVVALLLILEKLARWNRPVDVTLAATAQEEVGRACAGGLTSAFQAEPDLAVVLDVTHGEMPGLEEWRTFKLGGGPVLAVGPNAHPAVLRALLRTAEREGIPHQIEPTPGASGTEAWDIQTVGPGIPTGIVGIPLRYMHSAVETLALGDVERAAELVARFAMVSGDCLAHSAEPAGASR